MSITQKVSNDKRKYLHYVKEFLRRLNIPNAVERINDEDFIAENILPIASQQFADDYFRYRSADHYLRNREFYENPDNYAIHPIY